MVNTYIYRALKRVSQFRHLGGWRGGHQIPYYESRHIYTHIYIFIHILLVYKNKKAAADINFYCCRLYVDNKKGLQVNFTKIAHSLDFIKIQIPGRP